MLIKFTIGLALILLWELIGDFLWQSRTTAQKKSKDKSILLNHLFEVGFCLWLSGTLVFSTFLNLKFGTAMFIGLVFASANCLVHGLIDWNIWNLYKKESIDEHYGWIRFSKLKYPEKRIIEEELKNHKYWEDKKFYDFIGIDRYLHILTILITYCAIFSWFA